MKSPRSPRKKPVQDRSQITVDALVDAATRIFDEKGFDGTTTNRVAEVAGVSVGSLYQYFPNKAALLAAVREKIHREFIETMIAACEQGMRCPFEPAIRGMAEASAAYHARHTVLYRVFATELPATSPVDFKSVSGMRYQEAQARFFQVHAEYIKIPRDQALFFTRNAGAALMQAAVLNHPEKLRDGSIAAQLTRAFVAYLSGGTSTAMR